MTDATLSWQPLADNGFGRKGVFGTGCSAVAALCELGETLPQALYDADGLLMFAGLNEISEAPGRLVELSRFFGKEVEDYREAFNAPHMIHTEVPEILIVGNRPPVLRQPPARPDPPFTEEGRLPTRFPHRHGWHTDQSYRRPPPDISLFYCVKPAPRDQAQTLYANGTAAYEALSDAARAKIDSLDGIHCSSKLGRNEQAVRAGETPDELQAFERPQRQPLARVHPVTGKKALYLCESGQMDWLDGPVAGLAPGPDGEGGRLIYELMSHYTQDEFVYMHEWSAGDLIIYDNRCTVHSATWFDAEQHERVMWRTTVWGNPGPMYANEERSWRQGRGESE